MQNVRGERMMKINGSMKRSILNLCLVIYSIWGTPLWAADKVVMATADDLKSFDDALARAQNSGGLLDKDLRKGPSGMKGPSDIGSSLTDEAKRLRGIDSFPTRGSQGSSSVRYPDTQRSGGLGHGKGGGPGISSASQPSGNAFGRDRTVGAAGSGPPDHSKGGGRQGGSAGKKP